MNYIRLPRIILSVILLSICYWTYLALNTRMEIIFDSISYEDLGRLLSTQGFNEYFRSGPNREPIYPLLIASAISIGKITGLAYTKIMAGFGVLILFLTQLLTYCILNHLKIRPWICATALAYLGLSPAINNTAFSLYSEIAAYPFILGIILVTHMLWQAMLAYQIKKACLTGALLGLLFVGATLVKAIFECIFPLYILILSGTFLLAHQRQLKKQLLPLLIALLTALTFFYAPIINYKIQNKKWNGNFSITDRGPWALYGNTARRMEPLTKQRLLTALAYAPGEGLCRSLYGASACDFWSFRQSDAFGMTKLSELHNQQLPQKQIDSTLLKLSLQKVLENPFQYFLLTGVEGIKMFFWESTQIGFVTYPPWLSQIYQHTLFKNILRLILGLITAGAFFYQSYLFFKKPTLMIGAILLTIILYIGFFSFFFILTRYALPIAPLYIILIASSVQAFWNSPKECSKKIN